MQLYDYILNFLVHVGHAVWFEHCKVGSGHDLMVQLYVLVFVGQLLDVTDLLLQEVDAQHFVVVGAGDTRSHLGELSQVIVAALGDETARVGLLEGERDEM